MPTTEENQAGAGTGVDETIGKIESLYRTVTGKNPPPAGEPYAPIPVERDPGKFVEEQLDRLMAVLGSTTGTSPSVAWTPLVTIWENESEFLVCMELPGVTRKDVEVTLHGGLLTVKGQRPTPFLNDHRLWRSEGLLGPFVRRVLLPPTAHDVEPNAQMKDGVLEIRIARENVTPAGPRTIPVN
jgi:HSP20 family protein